MKVIELPFVKDIRSQLDGRFIQVLLGPRQVGKTTSLLNDLKFHYKSDEYFYENCDAMTTTYDRLVEVWDQTIEGKILVLDEIQKIPQWSEYIKKFWDQNKRKGIPTRCILLGSSSLHLQKGLSESLTGRFELTRAWHWDLPQSVEGYNVDLEKFLLHGGYPGSYPLIGNRARWKNYLTESIVETVIGKDILSQAHVKSPALFKQAFQLLASYPAQEISYNKLLGQLQDKGNIDLVKYYLELLEGAFLIKSIFKYSGKVLVKKSSSPKIIPLAPALCTYHLKGIMDKDYRGRIFESVVGSDLIRHQVELCYWRDGNAEVDYVFQLDGQLIALEVKSGRKKSTKGLLEFSKHFSKAIPLVISIENYPSFAKNPIDFLRKRIR